MGAFQATVGGRCAPLTMLVYEDADLDPWSPTSTSGNWHSSGNSWQAMPEEEILSYP